LALHSASRCWLHSRILGRYGLDRGSIYPDPALCGLEAVEENAEEGAGEADGGLQMNIPRGGTTEDAIVRLRNSSRRLKASAGKSFMLNDLAAMIIDAEEALSAACWLFDSMYRQGKLAAVVDYRPQYFRKTGHQVRKGGK